MSDSTLQNDNNDPLALYTRSLHDYTLALWTESRRIAEEKARARQETNAAYRTQEPQLTGGKKPDHKDEDPSDTPSSSLPSSSSDTQT